MVDPGCFCFLLRSSPVTDTKTDQMRTSNSPFDLGPSTTKVNSFDWASHILTDSGIPILISNAEKNYKNAVKSCGSMNTLVLFGQFGSETTVNEISELLKNLGIFTVWVGIVYDLEMEKWRALNGTSDMVWQEWVDAKLRLSFFYFCCGSIFVIMRSVKFFS